MAGLLDEVHPTAAATFAVSAWLLALLAVAAGLAPAWCATRVDPLVAAASRLNHCVISVKFCNRKRQSSTAKLSCY
jgi:hypothetical protein